MFYEETALCGLLVEEEERGLDRIEILQNHDSAAHNLIEKCFGDGEVEEVKVDATDNILAILVCLEWQNKLELEETWRENVVIVNTPSPPWIERLSLCLVSRICSSWSWILDGPVSGARSRRTGQGPPAAAADRGRRSSQHRCGWLDHPFAWGVHTGTDPMCQTAAGRWCSGETISYVGSFLYQLMIDWCIFNRGSVLSRWMLVTLMAALRCVMPVQLVAWSVWSCCWSMEQQLILHCLRSLLFMRPAWEVCLVTYNTTQECICPSRCLCSNSVALLHLNPRSVCLKADESSQKAGFLSENSHHGQPKVQQVPQWPS